MMMLVAMIMIALGIVSIVVVIGGSSHGEKQSKEKFAEFLLILYALLTIALITLKIVGIN